MKKKINNNSKKVVSATLLAPMAVSALSTGLPVDVLKPNVAEAATFSSGTGTVADPYIITTPQQLQAISEDLTAHYKLGANIDLTGVNWSPIAPTNATYFTGSFDGGNFTISNLTLRDSNMPTGDAAGLFGYVKAGSLLKNIKMTNVDIEFTKSIRTGGLVGFLEGNVENVDVSGKVTAKSNAGLVAGYSRGSSNLINTIKDVKAEGQVNSSTSGIGGIVGSSYYSSLENIDSQVDVQGSTSIGGIIGNASYSTVTLASSEGDVIGTSSDVGGIIGNASSSTVHKAFSKGTVKGADYVGGIIGNSLSNSGSILVEDSITVSNVEADGTAAGLIGRNQTNIPVSVKNNIVAGNVYAKGNVAGLVGYGYQGYQNYLTLENNFVLSGAITKQNDSSDGIADLIYAKISTGSSYFRASNNLVADDIHYHEGTGERYVEGQVYNPYSKATYEAVLDFDNTWGINEGNGLPYLKELGSRIDKRSTFTDFASGKGTVEDPYIIMTPQHLKNIEKHLYHHFELGADIDLAGMQWEPISEGVSMYGKDLFIGQLDGKNHSIKNLTITDTSHIEEDTSAALFARTGTGSVIKNINLVDVNINAPDKTFAAGLVGESRTQTFENITINGTVIGGQRDTGMLVGQQWHGTGEQAKFSNVKAKGIVKGINQDIYDQSETFIGGLAGRTDVGLLIDNSHFDGDIIGIGKARIGGLAGYTEPQSNGQLPLKVINSSTKGTINGYGLIGGFFGTGQGMTIEKSYALNDITVTKNVSYQNNNSQIGGLIGYSYGLFNVPTVIKDSYVGGNITVSDESTQPKISIGGFVAQHHYGPLQITNSYHSGVLKGNSANLNTTTGGVIGFASNYMTSYLIDNVYSLSKNIEGASEKTGRVIGDTPLTALPITNITVLDSASTNGNSDYVTTEKSEADFYKKATFANFDFASTWQNTEGSTLPTLQGFSLNDYRWGQGILPPVSTDIPDVSVTVKEGTKTINLSDYITTNTSDPLTYTVSSDNPTFATAIENNDTLTVKALKRGTANITVVAEDVNGGKTSETFKVTVTNSQPEATTVPNQSLKLSDSPKSINVATYFTDADSDSLSYSAISNNSNVGVSINGSTITIKPNEVGTSTITITANDGNGGTVSKTFSVSVSEPIPAAPTNLTGSATTNKVVLSWGPSDYADKYKVYKNGVFIAEVTSGSTFTDYNVLDATTYNYEVSAVSEAGESNRSSVQVQTEKRNTAPEVSKQIPNQTIGVDETKTITVGEFFTDLDNDVLSYTVTSDSNDVQVSLDGEQLTLNGISEGGAIVTITANDGNNGEISESFFVGVYDVPEASFTSTTIRFAAYPDAIEYKIIRDGVEVASIEDDGSSIYEYVDTDLTPGKTYSYSIEPVYADGSNGEPIIIGEVETLSLGLMVSVNENEVTTYWTDLEEAEEYKVTFKDSNGTVIHEKLLAETDTSYKYTVREEGEYTVIITPKIDNLYGDIGQDSSFVISQTLNTAPTVSNSLTNDVNVSMDDSAILDISDVFTDAETPNDLVYSVTGYDDSLIRVVKEGTNIKFESLGTGQTTATITATDPQGLSVSQTVKVYATNHEPTLEKSFADITIKGINRTQVIDLSEYFSDIDEDALNFTTRIYPSSSLQDVAKVEIEGNKLIVTSLGEGTTQIEISSNDGDQERSDYFDVTVLPNNAPTSAGLPDLELKISEGSKTISLGDYFTDIDGDTLEYTISSENESIAKVSEINGSLLLEALEHGSTTITVEATDGNGGVATKSFVLTVKNESPIVTDISSQILNVTDAPKTLDLSTFASDPENDELSYEATSNNNHVLVSVVGSHLEITPNSVGTSTITVKVSDGEGNTVEKTFNVVIEESLPSASVLQAEVNENNVLLSWTSVENADSYRIQIYKKDENGNYVEVSYPRTSSGLNYTVTGLEKGGEYQFKLLPRINWSYREDLTSSVEIAIPDDVAPPEVEEPSTPLVVENIQISLDGTTANISWDPFVLDEVTARGYRIQAYYKNAEGVFVQHGFARSTTSTNYSYSGLSEGIEYKFEIVPRTNVYLNDNVGVSEPVLISVPEEVPVVENDDDRNISVVIEGQTATITWDNLEDITRYRVQRYVKDSAGVYVRDSYAKAALASPYEDSNLPAGEYKWEITPRIGYIYDGTQTLEVTGVISLPTDNENEDPVL